jgi:hypothetical protein
VSAAVEYPRRLRSDITYLLLVPSMITMVSAVDEPPLNARATSTLTYVSFDISLAAIPDTSLRFVR